MEGYSVMHEFQVSSLGRKLSDMRCIEHFMLHTLNGCGNTQNAIRPTYGFRGGISLYIRMCKAFIVQ